MAKFSVKKPLTVFVAVVIVIVLGVVSFTRMTPDLLPNMDMPYILVVTPWPGATPEKVEEAITRPMEQSMATLEHISTISSTSSANSSMLVLEFENDVNMDTIAVDILQRINQLQGGWDDMVQTPTILKMNPSMIPVNIAAVKMDGKDTIELSTFVDETLMNKLEGIAGVASISATGLIEEEVHIRLDQQKIDAFNKKITAGIDKQFAETETELTDGKAEIEDNIDDLEGKMQQLKDGAAELAKKTAEGEATINEKQMELIQGKLALMEQLQALETQLATVETTQKQMTELQTQVAKLEETQKQLEEAVPQLQQLKEGLEAAVAGQAQLEVAVAGLKTLDEQMTGLLAAQQAFDAQIQGIKALGLPADQEAQQIAAITTSEPYQQLQAGLAALDVQLAALGIAGRDPAAVQALQAQTQTQLDEVNAGLALMDVQLAAMGIEGRDSAAIQALIDQSQDGLTQVNEGLATIDAALAQQGIDRAQIDKTVKELEAGRKKIVAGIKQLNELLAGVESGEVAISDAMQQLSQTKTTTLFEMSSGSAQIAAGSAQLNAALTQVESGLEQLEDARESAYKQANLDNILTMATLTQILKAENFSMPVGYVSEDGVDWLVSVGEQYSEVEQLTDQMLMDLGIDGVPPLYLRDVADIYVVDNSGAVYAKIDSQDGVLLTFSKQSAYATAEVSDNIAAKFAQLSEEYPGLSFVSLMDQGEYIYTVVNGIMENLLLGALFAILVLFLFLWDLRPTLITLCSIPISVIFALALMYFSGVTLNIISMSGLAVAVGMLVDNSVVVIENIYRLRALGMNAVKAAISGASQVAAAITSSTLTTVCVFLPIVFVEGITRDLFTDLALTMGFALVASLIVALTLVPAMSSGLLRSAKVREFKRFNRFLGGYQKSLSWALRHRAIVLVLAVVMLGVSVTAVMARGFTFMPDSDTTELTVTLQMPEGATLDDTRVVSDIAIERIQAIDGVETVGAMTGGTGSIIGLGGGGGRVDRVTMYVLVREGGSGKAVGDEIIRVTDDLDCEVRPSSSSTLSSGMSMLGGSGVAIDLYGTDMDDLLAAAEQTAEVLRGVEGIEDVDNGIGETDPELRFVVDKQKAMAHGLTVAQVYQTLSTALATETSATNISWGGKNYDVIILTGKEDALTPEYVKNYSFTVTNRDGEDELVYLRNIATIEETQTPTAISRTDQRRTIQVSTGVADGYNVTLVTSAAEQAMAKAHLPDGVSYAFSGENETIMDSFRDLGLMLLLGVLLVYLIMVAQFQSLKSPFIVMFTIPLAFTGGFLALLITGLELSVVALIGMVMLVGIIVNNGIVLVDYINQLRQAGTDKRQAIVEAGATRMRPILMTTITTVMGLLVMAFARGSGGELMQPVAVVCIGGLVYATALTLYVVPIMYDLMNRKKFRVINQEDLEISNE